MLYKKEFKNKYFRIKLLSNSARIVRMIKNFLDFGEEDFRSRPKLNIAFYINEIHCDDRNDDRNYLYRSRIDNSDFLFSSMGNMVSRITADTKKGVVKGDILSNNYKESSLERVIDLVFTQPLRFILSRRGFFFLHAAALSKDKKGVLITGAQDYGKSILALTLSQNGFGFLTDDKCFLRIAKNRIEVLPFPTKIGISDNYLRKHPRLRRHILKGCSFGGKKRISRKHLSGTGCVSQAQFRVLLFPKYERRKGIRIRPLAKKEALYRLVREHLYAPDRGLFSATYSGNFDTLSSLVNHTDSFELGYNDRNLDQISTKLIFK